MTKIRTKKGRFIETVPNQKVFELVKAPIGESYTVTNNEVKFAAMQRLTDTAYKLWEYFSVISNSNTNSEWVLSCNDVLKKTGISESSYHRKMIELAGKGYITLITGNKWRFIENGNSQ